MINACIPLDPELKLEKTIKIRVEPGIFEWTKWESGKTTPTLMTLDELQEAGFNVSMDYRWVTPSLSAGVGHLRSSCSRRNIHDSTKDYIWGTTALGV